MSSQRDPYPEGVDQMTLTGMVRQILSSEVAEVFDWGCQSIQSGGGEGLGVWRFVGHAHDCGTGMSWSLILKVLAEPAPDSDLAAWNYGKREVLAYESGLLDVLPGSVAAPRWIATTPLPGGRYGLWLEEIQDELGSPWPLARYHLAAQHFGQFNGTYLVEQRLPSFPWLSTGWLRSWLAQAAAAIAVLPGTLRHPLEDRVFFPRVAAAILRLWGERERFLDALDHLPHTLCHHDAFRRNLFAQRDAAGSEQTFAIDWAFVGTGPVGAEIVPLVAASLAFFEVDLALWRELDAAVFEGYLLGLRNTGWRGDPRMVRFAFTAGVALRYLVGVIRLILPTLLDERWQVQVEALFGVPFEDYVDHWASLLPVHLAMADEARVLMGWS